MLPVGEDMASSRKGKGRFRRMSRVRSSAASQASIAGATTWPSVSTADQRRMLAAQSLASTGVPSWKRRPSRSRMVHRRPSSDTVWPSAICGRGTSPLSTANSVSKTRAAWARVTLAVV